MTSVRLRHLIYGSALLLLGAGVVVADTDDADSGKTPAVKTRANVIAVTTDEDGEPKVFRWDSDDENALKMFGKKVKRGYLGVGLTELNAELRRHFGAPKDAGVLVNRVEPGSPAERAGIEVGDVVVALDGEDVPDASRLAELIGDKKDGSTVNCEVIRDGRSQRLSATLEVREKSQLDIGPLMIHPDGSSSGAYAFRFGGDDVQGWAKRFREQLDSPEFKSRIENARKRQGEVEDRLREMEKRLHEMEAQIRELEQKNRELQRR